MGQRIHRPVLRLSHLVLSAVFCGIVWPAICTEASWHYSPAGTVQATMFLADSSGQKAWLGLTRGGLWRSADSGVSWFPAADAIAPGEYLTPFHGQILDPNGDTLIVRASSPHPSQIWWSCNGGLSWIHFPDEIMQGQDGHMVIWRQNHSIWLHVSSGSFDRSNDGGQTWQSAMLPTSVAGAPPRALYQDPLSDSTIYFTSHYSYYSQPHDTIGGVARSLDLGDTWVPLIDFYGIFGITFTVAESIVRVSNGDLVVPLSFAYPIWENHTILLSTDNGSSWTRIGDGLPDRFEPSSVVEDALQPGTMFLSGSQRYGLYWSHDFGRTWSHCTNGLPSNIGLVHGLWQNAYSGAIYVAFTGYGVYETYDHGQSWEQYPMPHLGPQGSFGVTGETVFERDDGYRQWRLDPGADEWTEVIVPFAQDTLVMMRPVCYHGGDTVVSGLWKRNILGPATDVFHMIYSFDNGQSWARDPFLPFLPSYFWVYQSDNVVRFLDMQPNGLRWSEDLGHIWNNSALAPGLWPTGWLLQNETAFFETAVDSVTYADEIARSTDHGVTWQRLNFPGTQNNGSLIPATFGEGIVVIANGICWFLHQ